MLVGLGQIYYYGQDQIRLYQVDFNLEVSISLVQSPMYHSYYL